MQWLHSGSERRISLLPGLTTAGRDGRTAVQRVVAIECLSHPGSCCSVLLSLPRCRSHQKVKQLTEHARDHVCKSDPTTVPLSREPDLELACDCSAWSAADPEWMKAQTRAYTGWVNSYLSELGEEVNSLCVDLADGVRSVERAEHHSTVTRFALCACDCDSHLDSPHSPPACSISLNCSRQPSSRRLMQQRRRNLPPPRRLQSQQRQQQTESLSFPPPRRRMLQERRCLQPQLLLTLRLSRP